MLHCEMVHGPWLWPNAQTKLAEAATSRRFARWRRPMPKLDVSQKRPRPAGEQCNCRSKMAKHHFGKRCSARLLYSRLVSHITSGRVEREEPLLCRNSEQKQKRRNT